MDNHKSEGSFFKKITYTSGIYPALSIEYIKNPHKLFAIPLLGILIKVILVLPIFVEMIFLTLWLFIVVVLINLWVVLFSGQYWIYAHQFSLGFLKLSTKTSFYLYGLTDQYPGFDFQTPAGLSLDIPLNDHPNKLYAIPFLGGLIRALLLIPFFVFENIIGQAAAMGVFILAWAVVLFKGRFPEGIFELARDSTRVGVSTSAYMLGLSDRYPSFYISMKHDKIKLILIALAIIFSGWNYSDKAFNSHRVQPKVGQTYQYPQVSLPPLQTQ